MKEWENFAVFHRFDQKNVFLHVHLALQNSRTGKNTFLTKPIE